MIDFKQISVEDREIITSFTMNSERRNCDLSFANLCSWQFLYNTQYAVIGNYLAFKFFVNGQLAYMMPVGKGECCDILKALKEDTDKENQPFRMLGVCNSMKEKIETITPDKFDFTSDRNSFDYIYLRTDLAELKGKKYQPKRNHANKFYKTYENHEFIDISRDNIGECLKMEDEWCRANNCDEQNGLDKEWKSINFALKHFEEIGLKGLMLRVNGKIAAFTYGMPINQTTFGVHVEKADTEIEGAYTVINQEFANRIPEQFIYLNREEDLGIEGLRKAKLSYQPTLLLEKFVATLKG